MDTFVQQFHFLRPLFLLGIPAALLLSAALLLQKDSTRWEALMPADMIEALRVTKNVSNTLWKWLAPLGLILGSIAAAGPTWIKVPLPALQVEQPLVILLDMSPSMLATDVAPDRATRVKLKLIDILRAKEDGQTALVAYAGTPHRVAPLTDDSRTIEALLPALNPTLMPVKGSNTEAAIEMAREMLAASGSLGGDILLITDGVAPEAQQSIHQSLGGAYRLLILGVGSTEAVPVPDPQGGYIRDRQGEIVLTQLNRGELQILAGRQRGKYVEMQSNDSDIEYLMQSNIGNELPSETLGEVYDSWHDLGYLIILALIPLASLAFRRGLFFVLPLLFIVPDRAEAFEWQDLWQTPDQQASEALAKGNTSEAAERFDDPKWQAYAQYRDGNYDKSVTALTDQTDPTSLYNKGNALALNGDFEEAIAAYDQALSLDPDMSQAQYNKDVIEQLQQQQEEQEQQDSDSEDSEDQDQSENDQNSDSNEDSESGEQNEQDSDQDEQNSDQNEQSSDQNEQNSDQEEQSNEQDEQDTEQSEDSSASGDPEQDEDSEAEQDAQPEASEEDGSEEEKEDQAQADQTDAGEESNAGEAAEEQLQDIVAEPTPEKLDPASEQWLRAVPDDPSGLLREKFRYESERYDSEQRYRPPSTRAESRY